MNKLLVRTLSGIIYAGLIIGAIFAGKIWFLALLILFAVLAVIEFEKIIDNGAARHRNHNPASARRSHRSVGRLCGQHRG